MFYKPEFRKKISSRRSQLNTEVIVQVSAKVAAELIMLPAFLEARKIGFYVATDGECDPSVIAHSAQLLGKSLYLPVMRDESEAGMEFYPYKSDDELMENKFGVKEPVTDNQSPVNPEEIDCYMVPLIGFDVHGNRLGRGAGYYDKYLSFIKDLPAKKRPVIIGLAYEFQKISEITPDEWDVPMDYIVTETTLYERI